MLHGYDLFSLPGQPRFDLSRARVYVVRAPGPLPGFTLLCDGTSVARFRAHKDPVKDAEQKQKAVFLAEEHGLEVDEVEVSSSLADLWGT